MDERAGLWAIDLLVGRTGLGRPTISIDLPLMTLHCIETLLPAEASRQQKYEQ